MPKLTIGVCILIALSIFGMDVFYYSLREKSPELPVRFLCTKNLPSEEFELIANSLIAHIETHRKLILRHLVRSQ